MTTKVSKNQNRAVNAEGAKEGHGMSWLLSASLFYCSCPSWASFDPINPAKAKKNNQSFHQVWPVGHASEGFLICRCVGNSHGLKT